MFRDVEGEIGAKVCLGGSCTVACVFCGRQNSKASSSFFLAFHRFYMDTKVEANIPSQTTDMSKISSFQGQQPQTAEELHTTEN